MQLFATSPHSGDQIRGLQQVEVLRNSLPRHVQMLAQFIERAPVVRMQKVQQLAPAGIGQGFEQQVSVMEMLSHGSLKASNHLP